MDMTLSHIDEQTAQSQAVAAGFATVELYVQDLIDRDAERLAILEGVDDYRAGRFRPFEEFDREFRQRNGLSPRT